MTPSTLLLNKVWCKSVNEQTAEHLPSRLTRGSGFQLDFLLSIEETTRDVLRGEGVEEMAGTVTFVSFTWAESHMFRRH